MVTNYTSDRSFSELKRTKNDLRNSMTLQRQNSPSLKNIEYEYPRDGNSLAVNNHPKIVAVNRYRKF